MDKINNYNLPRLQQLFTKQQTLFMDFLSIGLIFFTCKVDFSQFSQRFIFFHNTISQHQRHIHLYFEQV